MLELPPSIAFLLDEFRGDGLSSEDVERRFKDRGFRSDLRDQCLAAIGSHPYADRRTTGSREFVLYATGGLSPLSDEAKCHSHICRMAYAAHFIRTSCLYGDRVILTDEISWNSLEYDPYEAFIQVLMLKRLQSFMEAGVIEFGSPAVSQCTGCAKVTRSATTSLTRDLWKEFIRTVDVFPFKYGNRWRLSFGSPLLYSDGYETRLTFPAPRQLRRGLVPERVLTGADARHLARAMQKHLRPVIRRYVSNLVFETGLGTLAGATIATSSGLGAVAFRRLDQRVLGSSWLAYALKVRSVPLITLQELWPYQVLELREKAQQALPAFRARLRKDLLSSRYVSNGAEEAERARAVAEGLADEALAVEAELAATHVRSVKRRERLLTGVGALLQIAALGTKQPELVVGASGVFGAALYAAHQTMSARDREHQRLVRQPAYVVLAAERLHPERHN